MILGDGASWGPIIDGAVLPGMPMKRIQAGTFNKVPVLGGITRDEGTIFLVSGSMLVMTSAEFDTLVTQVFGAANAAKVKAKYPLSNYKEVSEAAADLIGDAGFICPMRRTLRAVNSAGLKTYAYRYTRVPSFMNVPFLGCYHGAELAFVFHNPTSNGFTAPEKQLSKQMMGYWTRFARTGDPNGGGAPTWPLHAKSSDKHLQLDLTIKEGTALKQAQCDLWDTIDF